MRFKVTSKGNNSTVGDLFFSLPTQAELDAAADRVEELCRQAVPEDARYQARLEEELQRMREAGAAYHFLLMREISELDSIMLQGNVAGSLISKCLGLTSVDVLDPVLVANHLSTPTEFIWGLPGETQLPELDACINPGARPLIHSRLDKCYGKVKADDSLFRQITLPSWHRPVRTALPVCTDALCLAASYIEAKNTAAHIKKLLAEGSIEKKWGEDILHLTEEMKEMTACDLPTLVRLYGYLRGNFTEKYQLANLQDPWFFTTREEFYAKLLDLGMPKAEALDTVKYGVWSQGEKRERYTALLQKYAAPEELLKRFSETDNLWSAASILSRIHFLMQTM